MNVTSCVLAVFSPTGGTEKIARAVGEGTGLSVRTVDLSRDVGPCTVSAGELLVAACPQKARDLAAPMKLAVGTFLKASAGKPRRPELFL